MPNAYPKTFEVTAQSPEHEKAIDAVVSDPAFVYVPQEYPKAVGNRVVNSAEEEAALKGESQPSEPRVEEAPVKDKPHKEKK